MKYFIPSILALIFFITGLITLSDYGINWDSSIHFLRGQAYANFLLTGQRNLPDSARVSARIINPGEKISRYYNASAEEEKGKTDLANRPLPRLEFEKEQISGQRKTFFEHPAWDADYFLNNDTGHLPLIDILSAFSNKIFYQTLNVLSDIESYQLIYIMISAIGVFIVAIFTKEITNSNFASIIAALTLSFFPLFFAEAHFNGKDPIQASFFAGSIWAFWHWVKENKKKWFLAFWVFTTLALAVKWNIVFLPLILIPWLFLIRFKAWGKLGPPATLALALRAGKLAGFGILGIILFLIITWPAAWFNPFKLFGTVNYYLSIGIGPFPIQPEGFILLGFNFYPLILFLTQTPEIILILMAIAIFGIFKKSSGKLKIEYLIIIWFLITLIRVSLPNVWLYGGIRQFMEILPAMAILAGIGVGYLNRKFQIILLPVACCLLLFPIIKLHPSENVYFNNLAGGLKGAMDKNLVDWTMTYGNNYKEAVLWLNEHAQKDANLAHLNGTMFAIPLNLLRSDISISPNHFSGFEQNGEYIISLVDPLNPTQFAYLYPERFLTPIHQIKVDNVPMVNIYKNSPEYLKKDLQEESLERINLKPVSGIERDYFEIDLGKEINVTRITLKVLDKSCASGNNELIAFRAVANLSQKITASELYKSSEISLIDKSQVEFLFPAEKARVIQIFPENANSCFLKGRVLSVSFLQE